MLRRKNLALVNFSCVKVARMQNLSLALLLMSHGQEK